MKIKTHLLQFAMALCAVAFFSFTARDAQARILPGSDPGPSVGPAPTTYNVNTGSTVGGQIEPLPAIQPPVNSGTYNGTVMD